MTWPWPGDTPTERARRIANSLVALLPAHERDFWVAKAHELGETWLGTSLARYTNDDVVSTAEAAALAYVGGSTIRKWHSLGQLKAVGRGRYRVGDVLDCAAARRGARQQRRSA